jgi:hypothetical protein
MEKFSIEGLVNRLIDSPIADFPINTPLDLPNQRIISMDVARTKSSILTQDEKLTLEILLTLYCKTENITYKQGMNEIFAPFFLLSRQGVPLHVCYTCFQKFVGNFIPTLFVDDVIHRQTFTPLAGLFHITRLILQYHMPEIDACFKAHEITPDVYMTSWFVTMFSGKIKTIELVYMFWDALIERNDILYISYFGVSLLEMFKNDILEQESLSFPNVFKKIYIDNANVLRIVIQNADRVKLNMPLTSEMIFKKYDLFCLENTEAFAKSLEKYVALPILPREILIQTYPHDMVCRCANAKTCKTRRLKHLVIDCRPASEQKQGYLLNSHLLCKVAQKMPNKLRDYPKKFMTIRKNFHISLLGSNSTIDGNSYVLKLFQSFIEHGFPYISIIEGGYLACHEFAMQHSYTIFAHKEKTCLGCNSNQNQVIECGIDRFFKIESPSKIQSYFLDDNQVNSNIFKCKLTERQEISQSDLGLIIAKSVILLYDLRKKQVTEDFHISKLTKITKKNPDILTFTFSNLEKKRSFILETSEIGRFLGQVRAIYNDVKALNNNLKKLI